MNYNFDEIINRNGTDSVKWDAVESRWGRNDLIPMYCRRRTPPGDERYLFRYYNRRYHNGGFGRPQAGTLQDAGCQG